ncbi:hypothetical protein ZWY2020_056668 [Hordeum vulgare]|nr:hypothetical protein ZWY2020_056668 [Hordeum vulgare]
MCNAVQQSTLASDVEAADASATKRSGEVRLLDTSYPERLPAPPPQGHGQDIQPAAIPPVALQEDCARRVAAKRATCVLQVLLADLQLQAVHPLVLPRRDPLIAAAVEPAHGTHVKPCAAGTDAVEWVSKEEERRWREPEEVVTARMEGEQRRAVGRDGGEQGGRVVEREKAEA